ncbi:hypothetical protein [Pseudomonas indica]|uniref:hypothetical protein n=1 Tax=Pseudomonas indica TaxID=137658 RepID=UPI0011409F03|nr:hypothetical protein [Pseudomonas indica]
MKRPVLYIGGPGYSYERFLPLIDGVQEHFDELLSRLKISTPHGDPVEIRLNVEAATHDKIRAYARRVGNIPEYEIKMTAGLSYHLWLASRALASDVNYLPWIAQCKIKDSAQRKRGRREILADYAYHISTYMVLLHEISHVVLGHCDYVKDVMGFESLDEFQDEQKMMTQEEIKVRRAFEAEADRQAGEFLAGFFDSSLGEGGLGGHITFPSRRHAYEFYVYCVTLAFVLIQQLSQRKGVVHPLPNERQYIIVSAISGYMKIHKPEEMDCIQKHATASMIKAASKMGLIDADDLMVVINSALSLGFVDDVIKETGIRRFQHVLQA